MARNPNWTRDEVILALDLFLREGRQQLDAQHPKVLELSRLLNRLPIHGPELREAEFRNPAGVSMKLGNLLAVDPTYTGKGLARGSRLEQEIWDEFADAPYRLHAVAEAIRANSQTAEAPEPYEHAEEEEFAEGRILTRLHKRRERSGAAVRKKKAQVIATTGRLLCEACGFDFESVYGPLGTGFAECHHTVPVSELKDGQATRLSDLAIVCANCHRMIHRSRPLLTVGDLRGLLEQQPREPT
jgi:5-methylcytosine-specific restriction protein A